MILRYLALCVVSFITLASVNAQDEKVNVFVFSKTTGYRHKSIPVGSKFLSNMAEKNNWNITFSEDANDFTNDTLFAYDVLVFLNTTGTLFNEDQRETLKAYMETGRGFVGIHAAADTEKEWGWYTNMVGATFMSHPKIQSATIHINSSCKHPATNGLKQSEIFRDEWYDFKNVGKHITVLASLDESTYEGEKMEADTHPISWCHLYNGGRVFYTGLGHTDEAYNDPRFYKHIEGGILWASSNVEDTKLSKDWENLLEGDPYKNWDVFVGAPHASVQGLENVDPKSDGMNAAPLGLNNDPKNVFTFKTIDGEQVVRISGEIYGALTSKKEYENYHLRVQFKWGEKIWEPRLEKPRDSGILYHCKGAYTTFWNVWMLSQEFQVQEGDVGDYYGLSKVAIDIPSIKPEGGKGFDYAKGGDLNKFDRINKGFPGHCDKGFDNEKPHGEWNTLDLICFEGTSLHIVNGKLVMALYNSRYENPDKKIVPLTKGRIQIQSEAAEVFYKGFQIKSINSIPQEYRNQL